MKRVLAILAVIVAAVVAAGAQGKESDGYRVRAIFDSAAFIVPGEDVKVAGVNVGKIDQLEVTPDYKAEVEFSIDAPAFQDFREDAECAIRPQSLIGEQFIECRLTQPREAGAPVPPPLPEADDGVPVIPVENTRTTVALDLIGNINRLPTRQRLTLIINELGAGLAGRGEELNEVIRRAAPGLEETNEVLRLIADQNEVLDQLAEDSDRILEPLARERGSLTDFVRSTSDVADATVARSAELAENFERLPEFLREIQPTMSRLVEFSDEGIPIARELLAGADDINEVIERTGPFTRAATPALLSLGEVGDRGIPALRDSLPIVEKISALGKPLRPAARDLGDVLRSFEDQQGIERALDFIYYQVLATNGFDQFGHFLRAGLIVNTCSSYATELAIECSAKFRAPVAEDATATTATSAAVPTPTPPPTSTNATSTSTPRSAAEGVLDYLMGPGE